MIADRGLGLTEENGTLTGEIGVHCAAGGAANCRRGIKGLNSLSRQYGEYAIDIKFVKDPNGIITLYGHGAPTASKGNGYLFDRKTGKRELWLKGRSTYKIVSAAHEGAHILGLSHRMNHTNSLMSYAKFRRTSLTNAEAAQIVKAYE